MDRIVTATETSSETEKETHSKQTIYLVQNAKFDAVLDSSDSGINDRSESPARRILSLLNEIIAFRSRVDVGCGGGVWASVAEEIGASRILRLDGQWINQERLWIGQEQFREIELTNAFTLHERFDVAVSLEVAEHLPHRCADNFVASL